MPRTAVSPISDPKTSRRVAIINSRSEFIEALRASLETNGFKTAGAHLADIQDGTLDLLSFVEHHKPELIVYDLPRPHERHWNFLRLLKDTESLKRITWVLTTTDKQALEAAGGHRAWSRSSLGSRMASMKSLPLCKSASQRNQKNSAMSEAPKLRAVTVLVVDDVADVREALVHMLEEDGATVTAVDNATQALDLLQQLRPNVLLSDLSMPERDGLWLIRHVRALTPNRGGETPAACLTGSTEPEIRTTILRAGFQYHVPKPVHLETLIGIVSLLALKP